MADLPPSESPANVAAPPPAVPVSVAGRAGLATGLALGILGALAPAAGLAFVLSLGVGDFALAELLDRTGGLVPGTFGGGFWLSTAVNLAVLSWCVGRRLRTFGRPDATPWRPLAVLIGAYVALAAVLMPLDTERAVDVPDVLTTSILLGLGELWIGLVPPALLLLFARGLSATWRHGTSSIAAARRTAWLAGTLGLGGALLAGGGLYGVERGRLEATLDVPAGPAPDFVEGARRQFAGVGAAVETDDGPTVLPDPETACVERLSRVQDANEPLVRRAQARLMRRGLSWVDAEDVTWWALFKICRQYAYEPDDRVAAAFWTAIRNDHWKLAARMRKQSDGITCLADDPVAGADEDEPSLEDVDGMRRALDALEPRHREIIELACLEGYSHAEIGVRLGITASASAKRLQRGLDRLRAEWARLDR